MLIHKLYRSTLTMDSTFPRSTPNKKTFGSTGVRYVYNWDLFCYGISIITSSGYVFVGNVYSSFKTAQFVMDIQSLCLTKMKELYPPLTYNRTYYGRYYNHGSSFEDKNRYVTSGLYRTYTNHQEPAPTPITNLEVQFAFDTDSSNGACHGTFFYVACDVEEFLYPEFNLDFPYCDQPNRSRFENAEI